MSHLSLYCPPVAVEDDQPQIFSFVEHAQRARGHRLDRLASRARMERENSQCPSCRRVMVEPLELGDSIRNRNGASIPGTATVVAFRCRGCRHEWPVLDRA